jgi:RNA polymerase sigma factor (sigma-70 family)
VSAAADLPLVEHLVRDHLRDLLLDARQPLRIFAKVVGHLSGKVRPDPMLPQTSPHIARNFVLRALEKDRLQVPLEHDDESDGPMPDALIVSTDPLGDLTRNERIESVRLAVLALPPHYREVVVLCDFHEMSYAEAATTLDIAVGTVRSRLHRGHGLLVEKLRASGFTESATSRTHSVRCYV